METLKNHAIIQSISRNGADILPAPSAYKINTNAIGNYEMPLAIVYLFKSIIIESI